MSFRKFTEYGAASRQTITIRTNDLLFISKSILKRFNENAIYAYIHIDDENKRIGIEFLNEKPEDSNHRKISEEKAGISINIGPVLRFLGVGRLSEKYVTDFDESDGMLVFSIKDITDRKATSDN